MKPMRTQTMLLALGIASLMVATSVTPTLANSASWIVVPGNSWTWQITKCAWDQQDTTTTWIGRTATINVTGVDNSSTHAWITGNVWLKDADGSAGANFQGVLLGNVSTDGSELVVFANTSEFILPVIVPVPMSQSLNALADFLEQNVRDLLDQIPAGFPIDVSDNVTATVSGPSLTLAFTVNVTYVYQGQNITLTNQPFEVRIEFGNSVATRLEAYVKDITFSYANLTITVPKFTLFEITRSGVVTSPDIPGFPAIALAVIVPAATAILAWRAKRRHD